MKGYVNSNNNREFYNFPAWKIDAETARFIKKNISFFIYEHWERIFMAPGIHIYFIKLTQITDT